jgi:hypothetical protein
LVGVILWLKCMNQENWKTFWQRQKPKNRWWFHAEWCIQNYDWIIHHMSSSGVWYFAPRWIPMVERYLKQSALPLYHAQFRTNRTKKTTKIMILSHTLIWLER